MSVAGPNRRGGRPGRPADNGAASGPVPPGGRPKPPKPGKSTPKRATARPGKAAKRSFTIPSDFAAGRDAQQLIMGDVERAGFDANNTFAIRLALEEAVVNAIKHGNRGDASKKVHIQTDVSPKRAAISVEDEGPGFERQRVPDPTAGDNLVRPCGRGILLIESYMSDVTWDRGGRRVRMVRRNEPIDLG